MSRIISPILGVFGAVASFIPGMQPIALAFTAARIGVDYLSRDRGQRGLTQPISVQAPPPPNAVTVEHPIVPRMISYGRVKNPGAFFWKEAGPLKTSLTYGMYICDGPISQLESITCDDELVSWTQGSGFITPTAAYPTTIWAPGAGTKYVQWGGGGGAGILGPVVLIETLNATEAGSRSYLLGTAQPLGALNGVVVADAGMSGFWTDAHIGKGITAFYAWAYFGSTGNASVNLVSFRQQVYPNNWPVYSFVYRGAPVYDPRDFGQSQNDPATGLYTLYNSTWVWSENPALIAADYVNRLIQTGQTAIKGINWTSIAEAATDCDRLCPCYIKNFGGGGLCYEPFARFTGNISLELEPRDVLAKIMAVCDGSYGVDSDGLFTMWVGKWETPNVTFTDADISSIQEDFGPSISDEVNHINVTYTEPRQSYSPVQAPIYEDLESKARIGRRTSQIQLDFCPSPSQAWRMVRRHVLRQNRQRRISLTLGARGITAFGQRVVGLNCEAFSIVGTFRLLNLSPGDTLAQWSAELVEVVPDIFDDPAPPPDPVKDFLTVRAPAVPTPLAPVLSVIPSATGGAVRINWTASGSLNIGFGPVPVTNLLVDPNYMFDARFSVDGGATWRPVNVQISQFTLQTPDMVKGASVVIQTRFINGAGTAGSWSPSATITV